MKIPFKALGALGVATAATLSACSEGPESLTRPFDAPSFHLVPVTNPEVELLVICKVGPAGTYSFQANATHPVLLNTATGVYDQTSATYDVTVSAGSTINVGGASLQGACTSFTNGSGTHNHVAEASGSTLTDVTVVESGIPTGQEFVKVDKYQKTGGQSGTVTHTSSTVNTVTAQLGGTGGGPLTLVGANVVFYNQDIPQTGAGCTPGFWKQEQHFQYWTAPYAPTTVISTVFASAAGYVTSKGVNVGNSTLLQGLNFGGGSTTGDAAAILLRAGIAALLNAADSDVDYYLDVAGVISAVNAALASGDRNTMLTLASELDFENNRGCTAND